MLHLLLSSQHWAEEILINRARMYANILNLTESAKPQQINANNLLNSGSKSYKMNPLKPLLLILILFLSICMAAQKVYMKVTSSKTGAIKDQGMPAKFADKIELTGYSFDASSPIAAGGVGSGKRSHTPVMVTKNNNSSSVLLFAAQSKGEVLSKVIIEVYKVNNMGMEVVEQTIELTNAVITYFRQNYDNNPAPGGNKGPTDEIRFAYQKITYTYVNGGITMEDSW
jgi:type VI secretion system secreted protein Hcp